MHLPKRVLLALAAAACANDPRLERGAVLAAIATPPEVRAGPAPVVVPPAAPPGVDSTDGVDPDEAVALALWNNAAFQEALAALGFARADLAQAGMLTNPTFSILFPLGPKQLEFAAMLPLDALWLRPRRVAVAKLDGERAAEGLVQSGLDLVRDVEVATADLALAHSRADLAERSLVLRTEIADIAQRQLEAGDTSELQSGAAQLDAMRARDERERAALDAELAYERWLALLGWTLAPERPSPADAPEPPGCDGALDALLVEAEVARPDLRAAELAIEAAGRRMGLAVAQIFAITAVYDANGQGSQGFESGPGLSLALPVLDQNQAGRTRAHAELERATAGYARVLNAIRGQVRDAATRRSHAERASLAWRERVLPPLLERVRATEHALAAGEASELAVLVERQALLVGLGRQVELDADLRRSCAELRHAVGRRWRPEDPRLRLAAERP